MPAIPLHIRIYAENDHPRGTVVLLHGFLGSGTNWHSVARKLSATHSVLVPDLRNHGQSPHADVMNYAVMAEDLTALFKREGLDAASLVGHSMGGKLAMEYALRHPAAVEKLVVVDIAPVEYRHGFDEVFKALRAVDLGTIASRRDADAMMRPYLETEGLRQFLLQNLNRDAQGWRWRIDLDTLQAAIPEIQGVPPAQDGGRFEGTTRFIHGAQSDYVSDGFKPVIHRHFPNADFVAIPGAGHWVYAEQPQAFLQALQEVLD